MCHNNSFNVAQYVTLVVRYDVLSNVRIVLETLLNPFSPDDQHRVSPSDAAAQPCPAMFYVQSPILVSTLGKLHNDAQDRILKSPKLRSVAASLKQSRSVGDLVGLVPNPLGLGASDGSGYRPFGRASPLGQTGDGRCKRQVLCVRLQEVGHLTVVPNGGHSQADSGDRQPLSTTGNRQRSH